MTVMRQAEIELFPTPPDLTDIERLEAENARLKAKITALQRENDKLKSELALYSPERFPKTYQGAKQYIGSLYLITSHDKELAARQLNCLEFPTAKKGGKWDKAKIDRVLSGAPKKSLTIETTAKRL